jgi:divalent metal cation (Fe/Co/Zn/Cd) transporter
MGSYATAEIHIEVQSDLIIKEAHKLAHQVEKAIIRGVDIINTVNVHVCPIDDYEDCYD